jgi:NCS1 family nucleobase:cation symporter-1
VLGISVYVSGVLIQLPFVDTHFYSGPMVAQLGGVDISWIVGLVVPGILYYLLARKSAVVLPAVRSTKA